MRPTVAIVIATIMAVTASAALAQGTLSMYFIGPFEGDVTIKDYRTPGPPGYYYHPEEGRYPSYAECYNHPVRCAICGHRHDLGRSCAVCGAVPSPQEQAQARSGAIYSPRPIPGQYWYDKPMRSMTNPRVSIGWPYLSPRYQTGIQ